MSDELATTEAVYGPIGLTLPPGLSYDAWASYADTLGRFAGGVMWWIGDWWLYGERHYGEQAAQAELLGVKPGTLSTAAAVCSRIEMQRRIGYLTFSHHQAVAYMEPAEQDEWLERTEIEAWTVRQLREAIHPPAESEVCPTCGRKMPKGRA